MRGASAARKRLSLSFITAEHGPMPGTTLTACHGVLGARLPGGGGGGLRITPARFRANGALAHCLYSDNSRRSAPTTRLEPESERERADQRQKRQQHERGVAGIGEKAGHRDAAILRDRLDHEIRRVADVRQRAEV